MHRSIGLNGGGADFGGPGGAFRMTSGAARWISAANRAQPVAAGAVWLAPILFFGCAPLPDDRPSPAHTTYDAEALFSSETVYPASHRPFSFDERRLLFASDRTGSFNVFAFSAIGGEPEQLTDFAGGGVSPVSWFPDDDRFLYEGDDGGTDRYRLWVRELDGTSTDLTSVNDVRTDFLGWSADGSAFWVRSDERARPIMDVYRYSTDGYDRELLFRNDGEYLIEGIGEDGRWIALQRIMSNTESDLYLHDLRDGSTVRISPDVEGVRHRFMDFSPAGDAVYYGTDQFGEFQQVWRYDLLTGSRAAAEVAEWDIRRLSISPRGTYRIAQINENAFPAIRVTNIETGGRLALPELPVGEVGGQVAFSPSETKLLVAGYGTRSPADWYLHDLADPGAERRRLTRVLNPAVDVEDLVEAEAVRFDSWDGLEIPGFLYRPVRASARNAVPAVIDLHGGPGGISSSIWDERLQHLANHGYAVFSLNYRGSTGYGKTFLTIDDRRHGEADVGDILAARNWLAGLDWVDGERIGLIGDSFGGFLTLATLMRHPESFEMGIAGHASINWISTLTIAKDRLGSRVEEHYAEIGHPVRDAERLRRISPYFSPDRLISPLLMYYGANDPRYDLAEIGEFVEIVRDNGVPVEYMVFEGEGHWLVNLDNRIAAQEARLAFLNRYLR
jgi:dipeptidyl aminopeptidase/acylaminoacyl peptidase